MAKYESLAKETLWVAVAGRLTDVEPGGVIDIPDGQYVQTGEHGEEPLFKAIEAATPLAKAKSSKSEEK